MHDSARQLFEDSIVDYFLGDCKQYREDVRQGKYETKTVLASVHGSYVAHSVFLEYCEDELL